MDLDSREQQLRATFDAELEGRACALTRLLRRLEQGEGGREARAEIFDALFREAHSLKGAARAVELTQVEHWAHAFETALDMARGSGQQIDQEWFDAAQYAVGMFSMLAQGGVGTADTVFPAVLAASTGDRQEQAAPGTRDPAPAVAETRGVPAPVLDSPGQGTATGGTAGVTRAQAGAESVRVAVGKLDTLLAQTGELAVTHIRIQQRMSELAELRQDLFTWRRDWRACRGLRAGLRHLPANRPHTESTLPRELAALLRFTEQAEERTQTVFRRVEAIAAQLHQDVGQLGLVTQGIVDAVMAVRLLPVATMVVPFERMVRDLAHSHGKDIQLVLEGGEIEIDRKILEQLRDPLLHMVRNAVDHGIEQPDARQACGKPRTGTIRLAAAQRGGAIEFELEDDGAGLDAARIRQSAVRKGMLSDDQAAALDDQSAIELIFRPGFSTSSTITETSGRGVGLDVVRVHLERLNGWVVPASTPGRYTRFTLRVPLTLATTRAILVEQGGQLYAIPSSTIERTHRVQEQHLVHLEGRRTVAIEGHPVPVVELADVLERPRTSTQGQGALHWRPFFILRQDDRRVALLADQLIGEQEIVVKPLGWPLHRVRNVGGAAMLGSGQTIAILNPFDVLKTALQVVGASEKRLAPVATPQHVARRRRVLVVDDSLPTRTLERSILEVAGYDTAVATDGVEALKLLRSESIDLVVSDIEMPGLDGFALTAEIRRDERLRLIPVVLVTSMAADEHRERGVMAGADAYIVKGNFDQGHLLDTVSRLIA